jgi:phosphoribosylformylglycinamidine cyclo-ligase
MLDGIAIGLAEGAQQAGVSISGGEISQLPEMVRGFDLVGTAVGTVPLDRIIVGRDLEPGDRVIGLASNGIHSNGFTLARKALFQLGGLSPEQVIPELGHDVGEELLRPTFIYVREILELIERIPSVKALIHITGDGLLNLPRVEAEIGFVLDNLPPPPPIFELIQQHGAVGRAEMFEVFNMGVGFCAVVAEADVDAALGILARHGREAWVIGQAIADSRKSVHLPQHNLIGRGKRFGQA